MQVNRDWYVQLTAGQIQTNTPTGGVPPPVADTISPAIVHAVSVSLNGSKQPVLTFPPTSDPTNPGMLQAGMQDYKAWRALQSAPTVWTLLESSPGSGKSFNAPSVGLTFTPAIASIGVAVGTMVQSGSSYTLTNVGGADFFGAADAGKAGLQQFTGDFQMYVKVASFTTSVSNAASANAKVGLQARASLDPGSPLVGCYANPASQGAGFQAGFRALQAGATINIGETAGVYAGPIWLLLARQGNVFTMSASFDNLNFTQFATQTQAFPATMYVGPVGAAVDATHTISAQLDEFSITNEAPLSFTDTSVSQTGSAQNYLYALSSRDKSLNESVKNPGCPIIIPATGSGSMMSWMNLNLAPAVAKFLCFSTLNLWSSTPLDVINARNPTWAGCFATGVVSEPSGTALGKLPAGVDIFAAFPGNIAGITNIGGGGSNIDSLNTGTNTWLALAQEAQNRNVMVKINWIPNNPAGLNNSPWPNVLTPGTTTYITYTTWLKNLALQLKTLTKPFFFCPTGELNLSRTGFSTYGNWMTIGQCTTAQAQQLFALQRKILNDNGVTNQAMVFEPNFGQGNTLFGYSAADTDFCWADWQPTAFVDSSGYAAIVGTGKPVGAGSQITTGNTSQPQNSVNTYTDGFQYINIHYPAMQIAVCWGQKVALNQQLGAPQCLGVGGTGWMCQADLPPPWTTCGGVSGG